MQLSLISDPRTGQLLAYIATDGTAEARAEAVSRFPNLAAQMPRCTHLQLDADSPQSAEMIRRCFPVTLSC